MRCWLSVSSVKTINKIKLDFMRIMIKPDYNEYFCAHFIFEKERSFFYHVPWENYKDTIVCANGNLQLNSHTHAIGDYFLKDFDWFLLNVSDSRSFQIKYALMSILPKSMYILKKIVNSLLSLVAYVIFWKSSWNKFFSGLAVIKINKDMHPHFRSKTCDVATHIDTLVDLILHCNSFIFVVDNLPLFEFTPDKIWIINFIDQITIFLGWF